MAGLCGVLGSTSPSPDEMADGLEWTGTEHTASYDADHVSVRVSALDPREAVAVEHGDTVVLTWGELYGFEGSDGYRPRPSDGRSTAEYVADLHDGHGLDAIAGLNGEFIAVIHDRTDHVVHLCTDRLAVRDTYYTRLSGGGLAFSTQIQSLSLLPGVTPRFSPDMSLEYFVTRRTFGVCTPLEGTSLLGPGSVMTVDLSTGESTVERYWRPRFRPEDRPFSYFVDELVSRLRAALADRTRRDRTHGVLLSVGSDSRLILAGLREHGDVTAYHMADWMNTEARTAERVALTASAEFELLRRDRDYQAQTLRRTPALSNFVGTFNQAHAEGFLERIRSEVDVLFDGLISNTLFRGSKIPLHELYLPVLDRRLTVPYRKRIDSVERFFDTVVGSTPSYLAAHRDVRDVLRDRLYWRGGELHHHGIGYESPRDLFVFADFVPITNKNGLFMAQSVRQHLTHASPLFDNRLVDLALSMPISYRVKRDPINAALQQLAPDLAAIPHAETGIALSRPQLLQSVGKQILHPLDWQFRRSRIPLPQSHLTHWSWPNNEVLLREDPVFEDTLRSHQSTVEALPFLDWDGVEECFEAHRQGANHTKQLFRLLTFLEMPVTERVVRSMDT